jgi:hypothetical protein
VLVETLERMRDRTTRSLSQLPVELRTDGPKRPYPVKQSERLRELAARGEEAFQQHG